MIGSAAVLLLCLAVAIVALLAVEAVDARLARRHRGYTDAWARLFGETSPQASHVRTVSPDPCRACGRVGLHDEGCSRLDRLDAGMTQ